MSRLSLTEMRHPRLRRRRRTVPGRSWMRSTICWMIWTTPQRWRERRKLHGRRRSSPTRTLLPTSSMKTRWREKQTRTSMSCRRVRSTRCWSCLSLTQWVRKLMVLIPRISCLPWMTMKSSHASLTTQQSRLLILNRSQERKASTRLKDPRQLRTMLSLTAGWKKWLHLRRKTRDQNCFLHHLRSWRTPRTVSQRPRVCRLHLRRRRNCVGKISSHFLTHQRRTSFPPHPRRT